MDERAEQILKFWLEEVGEAGWYMPPAGLDDTIRARYEGLWQRARRGELDTWSCAPGSCLALLILLDQFPRNMFRGDARAFASDAKAVAISKSAIGKGLDQRIPLPERQFFYMPLMHSETIANQERSVRLILINFGPSEHVTHARAHRNVIRRFGRFPYRNAALGRKSTPEEAAFVEAGGYRAALAELEPAAAP